MGFGNFSWPRRNRSRVEEARESAEKATAAADPTMFSPLPPNEPFERVEPGLHELGDKIRTESDFYHEVTKSPEIQQIVSRILKGIINVSDVVRIEGNEKESVGYYSHEVPLERIEESSESSEIKADLFILANIFHDTDHRYRGFGAYNKNMALDQTHAAYFDFDGSFQLFYPNTLSSVPVPDESDVAQRLFILKKIDMLERRLTGEEGRIFLDSIIAATGKQLNQLYPTTTFPSDDYNNHLQEVLLGRIAHIKEGLSPKTDETPHK